MMWYLRFGTPSSSSTLLWNHKCLSIQLIPSLKAIMQTTARKNEWPLDRMCLTVDVTKKTKEDFGHPPREGAYLHGLLMEGRAPCPGFSFVWPFAPFSHSHLLSLAVGLTSCFVLYQNKPNFRAIAVNKSSGYTLSPQKY